MTSIIQKVRTSFTTQLTLWVATLVTVISVVVKRNSFARTSSATLPPKHATISRHWAAR